MELTARCVFRAVEAAPGRWLKWIFITGIPTVTMEPRGSGRPPATSTVCARLPVPANFMGSPRPLSSWPPAPAGPADSVASPAVSTQQDAGGPVRDAQTADEPSCLFLWALRLLFLLRGQSPGVGPPPGPTGPSGSRESGCTRASARVPGTGRRSGGPPPPTLPAHQPGPRLCETHVPPSKVLNNGFQF